MCHFILDTVNYNIEIINVYHNHYQHGDGTEYHEYHLYDTSFFGAEAVCERNIHSTEKYLQEYQRQYHIPGIINSLYPLVNSEH